MFDEEDRLGLSDSSAIVHDFECSFALLCSFDRPFSFSMMMRAQNTNLLSQPIHKYPHVVMGDIWW